MSLNGIESSEVVDAHKGVLGSDNAWLLLCYTSRDEVALHRQGFDGLRGIRQAIAAYLDKSPLYGFLSYRSKRALVKYVPEGTSRLLQARTSVHFQAVADKFSPHDATLTAATPDDLNDAAVRDALALPREEPNEDNTRDMRDESGNQSGLIAHERENEQHVQDQHNPSQGMHPEHADHHTETSSTVPRPSTATNPRKHNAASQLQKELDELDSDLLRAKKRKEESRPRSTDVMGLKAFLSEVSPPRTPAGNTALNEIPSTLDRDTESLQNGYRVSQSDDMPHTSHSSRPSTSDIWRSWKPKLKFGPRPLTDERTQAQNTERQKLPAGVRMKTQKTERDERPKSRRSDKSERTVTGLSVRSQERSKAVRDNEPPPPVPPITTQLISSQSQPGSGSPQTPSPSALPRVTHGHKLSQTAGGFSEGRGAKRPPALGLNAGVTSKPISPAPKSAPALTPEKQRLMRALQMRRQQQHREHAEPPSMPLATLSSLSGSRDPTPEPYINVKTDSGVDLDPSMPKSESDRPFPVTASKAPFGGRLNPLQSHPVNTNLQVVIPPPRMQGSPSPSSGSNKELPKLPHEAEQDHSRLRVDPRHHIDHENVSNRSDQESRQSSRSEKQEEDEPQESMEGTNGSELYDELEGARLEKAQSLAMPPQINDPAHSVSSPTVTSVTIRSSSLQGGLPGINQVAVIRPQDREQSASTIPASLMRKPSDSSRPVSTRPSEPNRSVLSSKRSNMSSGISRRIQALAELSYKEGQDASTRDRSAYDSAQAFLAPGTLAAERGHAQTSTAVGRAYEAARSRSPPKHSNGVSRGLRVRNSLENPRTGTAVSDNRKSENPTGYRKRDSLTVTAHIMRGHQQHLQQLDEKAVLEEPGDRQNALHALAGSRPFSPTTEPAPALAPLSQSPSNGWMPNLTFSRRESAQAEGGRRPSSRGSAVSGRTRTSLEGWRSAFSNMTGGRRDSNSSKPRPFMPRISTSDQGAASRGADFDPGLDRLDEVSEAGTRASRTSRMLKRMSQISGTSDGKPRRAKTESRAQAANGDEDTMMQHRDPRKTGAGKSAASSGKSVIVGDLNAQFPDTLLWKRRWVEVDVTGNLVLSAPSSTPGMRSGSGTAKRYHLTEFKQPVIPSRDRQEMPHSVVLDFVEGGGTLQLAAEDRVQQGALVKRLVDSHRTWLYSL